MFHQVLPPLFAFLVVFVSPSLALGQFRSAIEPAEIRGQLRYAKGGAPAADVIVRLDRFAGGFVADVRTDRLGKFRFSSLSPIQYQVIIRHPGYQEVSREVNLIMTGSEYLQLQLVADEPALAVTKGLPKVLDVNLPPEARKEFEKGEAMLASDKGEESIRHFERAVAIYPRFLEAQLKLGTCYMDLQQWSKAEAVLHQANETHPSTPNVLFALGELYFQQKKTSEAEKTLRAGLTIEPRSWQGHFTLGRLYWSKGDLVQAARQTAITIQLNPNLAEAHLLAGNIFLRARKVDDAQFEFEEYLRLAPKGKFAEETKEILQKIKSARNKTNNK